MRRTPRVHLQASGALVSVGKKRKSDVSFGLQDEVKKDSFSQPANVASEEFQNSYVASGLGKHLEQDTTTSKETVTKHLEQAANKFCGKPLSKIYVLEIFAGSARLSKAALEQGFASSAIDHKCHRASGIAIQHYDLTDPSHLESLVVFIQENKDDIAMVWMAPPCGTASKARERPPKHLERMGMSIPKPLRSKEQPDQLDGLGGINKIKTETANILYDAVHVIATTCYNLGIFVVSFLVNIAYCQTSKRVQGALCFFSQLLSWWR